MIKTSIAEMQSNPVPVGAIILYGSQRGDYGKSKFATIHHMDTVGDKPLIMPGRPMSEKDLASIYKGLSSVQDTQSTIWLDQKILAKGTDRMIWWTPAETRPMFFKHSSHVKNTFDGSAVCPVPALVWLSILGKGLYLFAVKEPGRPSQNSTLFQAPFFNVWGRGLVCTGNATLPREAEMWDPKAWEIFFFGSHFTHPNFVMKDRLIKGKHPVNFWKEVVATPPDKFPENRLVRMPLTIQDLLDPLVVDKLNKLPRPTGEF